MERYDTQIFAKNLTRLLETNHISQREIAKILSVSSSTVSNWCTGQKVPRMDKIERLASFFSVLKSDLIEKKPTPVPVGKKGAPQNLALNIGDSWFDGSMRVSNVSSNDDDRVAVTFEIDEDAMSAEQLMHLWESFKSLSKKYKMSMDGLVELTEAAAKAVHDVALNSSTDNKPIEPE